MTIQRAWIGLIVIIGLMAYGYAIPETPVAVPGYVEGNTLVVQGKDLSYQEACDLVLENERLRGQVERLERLVGRIAADLDVIQGYIKVTGAAE